MPARAGGIPGSIEGDEYKKPKGFGTDVVAGVKGKSTFVPCRSGNNAEEK